MKYDILAVMAVFFLIGCYPFFGCARKQSVSTYASILASPLAETSYTWLQSKDWKAEHWMDSIVIWNEKI